MEDVFYLVLGFLIALPMLYFIKRSPWKYEIVSGSEDKKSYTYIAGLNDKFQRLLECIMLKQTPQYDKLYSELDEGQKKAFSTFMNTKLQRGAPQESVADPLAITKWDFILWFLRLIIETSVILLVCYFIYLFLSPK